MTVRSGRDEIGAELRRKRLQREAARTRPDRPTQPFAAALEMLVDLAKYLGAFGVIGLAVGMVVATKYGVDRGAVPQFSGDEWLPQLASLGLFCGVFAMFLVTLPVLDSLARGPVPRHASQWRPWPRSPANWPRMLGLFAVYLLEALVLVSVVAFPPPWLESYLLAFLVMPLSCAALDTVLAHWDAKVSWWRRGEEWVPKTALFLVSHLFYVVLLMMLVAIFWQKRATENKDQLALALGLLALALAVYRALAFGAAAVMGIGRELVACLVVFVAMVGVFASGETVRAAGLGNLPNVQLQLERGLACAVAEHLQLAEWHLCLYHRDDKTEDTQILLVDIVNRTGGRQVLAAPGMLLGKPTGRCATGPSRPDTQAPDFVCIEIGGDAVQAVMR